tara:strand:- start:123 stop:1163 length:1041 start_codon:yes stop_codon:yes gene_type:complete
MGISKTTNGKFRVFVSVKGRGRKSKVVDTHDEALTTEEKLRGLLIDGKKIPAGRATTEATLEQACEACYNDPETGWKDTDHGRKQRYYFSKFYSFWGKDKLLREINKEEWYNFTSQFSETATNNRRACCINKVFRHALEQGTIAPQHLLKIPRKKEKLTRLAIYTYEQEEAIYAECQKLGFYDLEDFVKVLIDTGTRAEECIKLAPTDLMKSKDGWTAHVYRNKTDTHTSIGLATRTKEIFMRRSNRKTFFETSYRQMSYKWQMVRQQLGQADNKDWVFHTCRHTCASRLAEAGATFMEVCDWMGWSFNSPVARRYIHFFPKGKIKMAKKLDNLRDELKVVSGGKS